MSHFNITIIGNRIAAAAALLSLGQRLTDNTPLKITLIAPQSSQNGPQLVGEGLPPTILLPSGELAIVYFTNREHIAKNLCRDKNQWQNHLNNGRFSQLRV
jgi:hypothetical protein